MNKWLRSLAIALGLSLAGQCLASDMDKYQTYQLKNGLNVIVKVDKRAPVVMSQIWYKVGSAYELPGFTGISHALEHMMFQGTKTYPEGVFLQTIAENGGQQNAFTSRDFTAYYEEMSADKLPISFKLEADRMQNLALSQKNFQHEIKVVKEERRLRTDDNPQAMTMERLNAIAHLTAPYQHPTIGWMSDLQSLTDEDLQSWYKMWYVPNNATLVVVGDVKPKKVFKLAQQYFGNIPARPVPKLKPQTPPKSNGQRSVIVRTPAKLPWLVIAFNTPSLTTARVSWEPYALYVLAAILDGGDSARLPSQLVRQQQVAVSVDAQYDPLSLFADLFYISGTPGPAYSIPQLEQAFLQQIEILKTTPISEKEMERIKTQVIASRVYSEDSIAQQAMEIGETASLGLPLNTLSDFVSNVRAITPQQVQDVAKKYFSADNMSIALLQPQSAGKPAQPQGGNANAQ